MNNKDLNNKIAKFCQDFTNEDHEDITVVGLEDSGKIVPYIGWFWRLVDFDKPIRLGYLPCRFVGFMENNKWDYDEWQTTEVQSKEIVRLLEALVTNPTSESAQGVFDYLQTCIPSWVKEKWAESPDAYKLCRAKHVEPTYDCIECGAQDMCQLYLDWVDYFEVLRKENQDETQKGS